ncbi:MAG: DUF3416 domain-containing protein, partial [Chloroflexia bacterium]|nr:DUF3416 domain-containing protein [Chloroflexia bacterium]
MTRHLIPNGTDHPPTSIVIEAVQPELDCGRYPVKREVGDVLDVTADIFREGHDKIMAVLRYRRENQSKWLEVEMRPLDNDRWAGSFLLSENTTYRYTIEAFPDHFGTWRDEVEKKVDVTLDVASELLEGRAIVTLALERSTGEDHALLEDLLLLLDKASTQARSVQLMLHDELAIAMRRNRSRSGGAALGRELRVTVDRVRARYAAWYE